MAQKVHIVLEDDLDGSPADETVSFGIDGTTYEIDLTDANAAKLRDALAPFIGHARKVSGGARRSSGARKATSSGGAGNASNAKEVRAWARENGHDVPERGRSPAEVQRAYDDAH